MKIAKIILRIKQEMGVLCYIYFGIIELVEYGDGKEVLRLPPTL